MGCCGTTGGYEGCCKNTLVDKRCTDTDITVLLLGDQNGLALVDDDGTGISLGIARSGGNVEFEFNRQTS